MVKTCGIIVIGDEILSGRVQDCNALYMARELRPVGIDVKRMVVIPDVVDIIAEEARYFTDRFDYVFTSGGIGPTHDDVTVEGIARAFDVPVVMDAGMVEVIRKRMGERFRDEALKMAEIPQGADLIYDDSMTFPLIQFKNIYIFPGMPTYMRQKFEVLKKRFDGPPILLKKVFVNEYETGFAVILNQVVERHREIKIGSYPIMDNSEYKVMLTFESIDTDKLSAAVKDIVESLTSRRVVKVEG